MPCNFLTENKGVAHPAGRQKVIFSQAQTNLGRFCTLRSEVRLQEWISCKENPPAPNITGVVVRTKTWIRCFLPRDGQQGSTDFSASVRPQQSHGYVAVHGCRNPGSALPWPASVRRCATWSAPASREATRTLRRLAKSWQLTTRSRFRDWGE